ncbi:MAG: tetratricopeptide repeat protein [Nannocystaceae bacterium]|nr:tetratricopeptide repeat protein [Nannocystaceae bacterium]
MAFSKVKAFDRAERFAAKGQHDKAVREYQAIVDNDPKEIRAWLMLADCLVRCGDSPRAIERYLQVGGYYIQKKDHQKALAVYRQVLNLDASRIDVQLRVAALNQELGRVQDAVAMYERVAGLQLQAGKTIDALQTYKVVADADPAAVSRRLRLAELYSREKQVPEAVDAFREAGEQLLTQGRKSDYVRVAERLLYHEAGDLPTVRKLAAVYLELGDPRRALMKLNGLLHADAGDREGIELLAQTFMSLGKPDKAVSAIGELARSLRESGSPEELLEAARVLRLGLSWSPGHADLVASLAQVEGRDEDDEPAETSEGSDHVVMPDDDGSEAIDLDDMDVVEIDDDDVLLEDDAPAPAAEAQPDPQDSIDPLVFEDEPAAVAVETQPPADSGRLTQTVLSEASAPAGEPVDTESLTDFDKILFEARVYIKYRLFEHAQDHVSAALRQQPQHVGALSLQARALTELGRTVEAADAHARVARLVIVSDPKLAREHIGAALNLAPGHVEALQAEEMLQRDDGPADEISIVSSLTSELNPAAARTELLQIDTTAEPGANLLNVHHAPAGSEDEDFPIEVDLADDTSEEISVAAVIEIEDRFGLDPSTDDSVSVVADAESTSEYEIPAPLLVDEEPSGGFEDVSLEIAEHGERGAVSIDLLEPNVDTGLLQLNDHVEPKGTLHPESDETGRSDEPDLLGLAIGKDQARALEPAVVLSTDSNGQAWPDISDDIAEVRFYLDQGLDDDASAALDDIRSRHPDHPGLSVFDAPAEVEPVVVPVESGASSPLLSLDEDDDDDAYLSAIFSEPAPVKAEVRTGGARVASEDVDAQSAFDLGVAYREMGLVDQAVAQFEAATAEAEIKVRALVMLGALRLQQGNAGAALGSLEEAAALATQQEMVEVNYELGVAYEKIGDKNKAIACLSEVGAGYRDRDERLDQLQR